MSDFAIQVENLSKAYRIGLNEERHETLVGSLTAFLRSPLSNFQKLRKLAVISETGDEEDIIWALRDVSFELKHGEVLGIIGPNGAGKSTLLKILSKITEPTLGRIVVYGRVASLLEVGTGFHPDLTGRENVYLNGTILGMKKREIDRRFAEIVEFSGIEKFIDTPVKRYSSGMRVRLAFSVAAHLEPEVLIIDEVLAVGDAAFQQKCLGKMDAVAKQGRTVLFVSHNMGVVSRLCQRGLVLNGGRIQYSGSAEEAISIYNTTMQASLAARDAREPHVLFEGADQSAKLQLTRVEVLDAEGQPKSVIKSWEPVVFRVHYRSEITVKRAAVSLLISSVEGAKLLRFGTEPDRGFRLVLTPGEHRIDCCIDQLPLAAGHYVLGGGLAVPWAEWLWRNDQLGLLRVEANDVYGTGFHPDSKWALLAVPYEWRNAQ